MKKHKILKRLASLTMAAALTISGISMSASAATVSDFTDVNPAAWYYQSVEYAVGNGLFSGTTATKFSPNASMTRGMFVTVLGRLSNIDESQFLRYRFSDVKIADYYAPYVEWAATYGIVNGVTKTTFEPNKTITREQMAAILYRYAAATGNDTDYETGMLAQFPDGTSVLSYAQNAMGWAVSKGIMNGMGGKLNPRGTATRAQVAKVFFESQNVLESTDIVIDPVEDKEEPETPTTPDSGTDNGSTGNGLAQYDESGYCTVLTNGKPATAKNVTELIESLRDKYPEGATSPDCAGSAQNILTDVFGQSRTAVDINYHPTSLETAKPGDMIDYHGDETTGHTVVVMRKCYTRNDAGDVVFWGLQVVEGNYNRSYHWDRLIRADDVASGNVILDDVGSYY